MQELMKKSNQGSLTSSMEWIPNCIKRNPQKGQGLTKSSILFIVKWHKTSKQKGIVYSCVITKNGTQMRSLNWRHQLENQQCTSGLYIPMDVDELLQGERQKEEQRQGQTLNSSLFDVGQRRRSTQKRLETYFWLKHSSSAFILT